MPRTRAGRYTNQNSSPLCTTNIDSHGELFEPTHILLRELSTQKLFIIELKLLSNAIKTKPMVIGNTISFRPGTGRTTKKGEIILVGTYNEVVIEMNNHASTNDSTQRPENLQHQINPVEQNHNDMNVPVSNSPILPNVVESIPARSPSPFQLYIDENTSVPSPSVISSAAIPTTTATVTSDSLLAKYSTTASDEIPMQNNLINIASSITIQRPSLSSAGSPSLTKTVQNNRTASLLLVPSTTIKRKMASSEAIKELKLLQSTVNLRDAEIKKLKEQNEKLKHDLEETSKCSMSIPTDDVFVKWIDYMYESVHKEEIRLQIDLDEAAKDLGIDRDSLDLSLELGSGDRISTARKLFKQCTDYEEDILEEHCWQSVDENVILKICRFVREFFGASLKHNDDYVRESLSNMMRKDSWKIRNPEKAAKKLQSSRSTLTELVSQPNETIAHENDQNMDCDDDDDAHF